MDYELSTDPRRIDMDVVHGFLSGSYWSTGIRREVLERAIASSMVCGAYAKGDGAQVGFVRLVTDRATFAWVCDVFVLERARGKGLARRMLAELHAHPELQTLRRWCLATRDAHGVYRPMGYAPVVPERWMERVMPREAWAAD
jgi:GNAT superfamily N-acetyltransferase